MHAGVMKREAWKEQKYSEEKAARDEEVNMRFGTTDMSKEELRKVIDSDRRMYYRTEELNDKLYIHYKGWKEIKGLEGWTGLKALYAECNAFSKIQGLHNCRAIRSLFLSENCIRKIEGLETCVDLWSLNLSSNFIERIDGLSKLRKLNTLIIAKNKIGFGGVDDVAELLDTTINTLDIQGNRISDPDVLPEIFARMSDLRVLYLKDNPCGKKIPNYRKGITAYCKNLKYLDDRPVFPEDRRAAEAFNRGGLEEERAERRLIRKEADDAHTRNMKAFQEMVELARAEGREKKAMRAEDKYTEETDPVDTVEKRMKRQVDEWREEKKDELRDEGKEWAQRCLAHEREGGKNDKDKEKTWGGDDSEEYRWNSKGPDSSVAEPAAQDSDDATQEIPAEDTDEKKVDNRKLVYENIWDDAPPPTDRAKPGLSAAVKKPAFAPPPRSGTSNAAGARGVAGVAAAVSEAAAAAAAPAATQEAGRAADWYTRFAQISGKKAGVGDQAAAAELSPPDQPGAELDEMD